MAMVGQEPALFSFSIRRNIAYGMDHCTDRDVISAAKQANAHDFISALPNGYDTMAGERGLQLSGENNYIDTLITQMIGPTECSLFYHYQGFAFNQS